MDQWQSDQTDPFRGDPSRDAPVTTTQWVVAGSLCICILVSLAGWGLSSHGLGDTGAYFIVVPGLAAACITLIPASQDSHPFGPFRTTTIVLLASAIFIREGVICVAMASPLIFLVVGLAVFAVKRATKGLHVVVVLPLLLLLGGLEGTAYDLPDQTTVAEVRSVAVSASELDAALNTVDGVVPEVQPLLFHLPFPKPVTFEGTAADIGDTQRMEFTMGELELVVTERSSGHVRFELVDNTTPINDWYELSTIELRWQDAGEGAELTVEIDYRRKLSPAFYFDPLGRFGVGEMAEVIADMVEANA